MKKAVITLALVLSLCTSTVLASCTANTTTGGNGDGNGSGTETSAPKETSSEGNGTGSVIDEAESKMGDMSEHATHGVEDGTPGGHSTRGGAHMPLIPRGK